MKYNKQNVKISLFLHTWILLSIYMELTRSLGYISACQEYVVSICLPLDRNPRVFMPNGVGKGVLVDSYLKGLHPFFFFFFDTEVSKTLGLVGFILISHDHILL